MCQPRQWFIITEKFWGTRSIWQSVSDWNKLMALKRRARPSKEIALTACSDPSKWLSCLLLPPSACWHGEDILEPGNASRVLYILKIKRGKKISNIGWQQQQIQLEGAILSTLKATPSEFAFQAMINMQGTVWPNTLRNAAEQFLPLKSTQLVGIIKYH